MAGTECKWLWKKTDTEIAFEPYCTVYQLTLVTRDPLQEEQVVCALKHLYRKTPNLRACFGERDGESWIREMPEEVVDFEMLSGGKMAEIHYTLQQYDFNMEKGPLWCVKLRPNPQCTPDGVFRETTPDFPHMYTFFFGINHAITDGNSNTNISGFFVQLLDEVLGGKPIDDKEQFGIYLPHEKTKQAMKEQEEVIKSDPALKNKLIEEYKTLQGWKPYVKSVYKVEGDVEGASISIPGEFDTNISAAFIKQCRAAGITVNTGFTAVVNVAMVELLAEGGLEKETYTLRSEHVLNARRYWGGDTSPYLGCHLMPLMPSIIETPRNAGEKFWEYAKGMNEDLYGKIVCGKPLQEQALKDLELVSKEPDPTFEFEFCVTNMGEVTKRISKGVNHVKVIHVMRDAAIHFYPFNALLFLHSFGGRLIHTLTYNPLQIPAEIAQKLFDKIHRILPSTV